MACTTLTVTEPAVTPPSIDLTKYGFAEIEWVNRIFETPCTEDNIVGSREAIGLVFSIANAKAGAEPDVMFTVRYLRPGDTVKTVWSARFNSLSNGTYEKYIFSTDFKYIKGKYTGLNITYAIV